MLRQDNKRGIIVNLSLSVKYFFIGFYMKYATVLGLRYRYEMGYS